MTTATLYNHSAKLLANKEVDLATLRVCLVDSSVFDAMDIDMTYIFANEVFGNGWTANGETLANAAVTQVSPNDAKLDADDVSVTATGGNIGPALGAVVYADESPDPYPLIYIDFEGSETAGNGTNFNITWDASGIITFTVA